MASREKKPLAPAKSKQKANNNFGSASVDTKSKKSAKSLIKHQAIICDIIEAVATNSQLPPKLEAGLPRKKALSSLKCKSQKLKVVKSGLLKAKQKVPIKSLKRISTDKRPIKAKKVKEENPSEKNCDELTFDGSKSAKNHIRASKTKKEDDQSPKKPSPKTTKKGVDSPARKKSLVPKGQKELKGKKIVIKQEDGKCSIDLTIDEVIASMLSDSEDDKKMLVNEAPAPPPLLDETQIKKELIEEEERVSEEETADQASNSLKKKPKSTRSLRNGKLRLSDSGISIDLELSRRRKRLDSEDPAIADVASDGNVDSESCMSENSAMEVHNIKEEDTTNHMDSGFEVGSELENNNNGSDRGEGGPTLRSKTKTRSGSEDKSSDDLKPEDSKAVDGLRKERILVKISNEKKCRRNSVNLEVKKTVNAFSPLNKTDETSQIDKMIENIKLTIAKSIENKIFGADKALLLGKNFEVPKIEEVVAPLSAEQKLGLDDHQDEEKPNSAENKDQEAEDAVPKVADTAKEIEKLVMGESVDDALEPAEAVEKLPEEQNQCSNSPRKSSRTSAKNHDLSSDLGTVEQAVEEELCVQTNDETVPEGSKTCNSPKKAARKSEEDKEGLEDGLGEVKEEVLDNENEEKKSRKSIRTQNKNLDDVNEELKKDEEENVEESNEVDNLEESMEVRKSTSLRKSVRTKTESPDEKKKKSSPKKEEVEVESVVSKEANPEETFEDLCEEVERLVESIETVTDQEKVEANSMDCEDNLDDEKIESFKEGCDDTEVAVQTKDEPENNKKVPEMETEKKQEEGKEGKEDNKRVLRTRDKQRKNEKQDQPMEIDNSCLPANELVEEVLNVEPQVPRTRRSRDLKRRKEDTPQSNSKVRRTKKDSKKVELQIKEETLLDNEVATINENKSNFEQLERGRGDSEPSQNGSEKSEPKESNRSKSENDIARLEPVREESKGNGDDASCSGESASSLQAVNNVAPLEEHQENMSLKVAMLGMLGLAPLDKVEKHLENQKMKEQYTGTLKTVIKVNSKEKKRSRSPLKMVLKQGRAENDGETLEFYTIQKELGTTGLGDSSSGANRKISTNHRPLCDEDEETPSKDRQSLVIPEKSSSFSIHPERLCADVCCYCHGKFGSLDTPMHLAQIKSDDRMKKILVIERHLTKDSCLCDACFRHVDRKAHVSPTNMQSKPQKQHRQLMNTKCAARDCKETAKHNVKRRWLIKIKSCVQNQMDIDWESSQHSSMSFCATHYPKIEKYLTCSLCKRRLAKNQTHLLPHSETAELNQLLAQHGIPVDLVPGTFVCKLCRYFTQIQLKYKDLENMGSSTKTFFKNYRKRILQYHNIEVEDDDEPMPIVPKEKDLTKDKESKAHHTPAKKTSSKCLSNKQHSKGTASKSPDLASSNPPSRKSTPEPLKTSTPMSETSQRAPKGSQDEPLTKTSGANPSIQYLTIESTIEKLKKRKAIDSATNHSSAQSANDVVEILAMDKEVTLTRLPKRPKTQNNQDITPVVQRLGANPSISVRTLFPGEEEMNLHANIDFNNVREVTPQGWEKCSSVIQYDRDTKLLWQTLQRPYGNQSSFLRHLVLLEKYYRAGDLVLAPKASHNALNYSTSVRNRLISYEGPEKMDEPINEPVPEFPSPQRSFYERPGPSKVIPLTSGVSIIKKPPPSLQRIGAPSTSQKKSVPKQPVSTMPGGQVFQMSEPEYKKFQTLKKQKHDKGASFKGSQNQKTQHISQQQFQEHLRKQQEMLSRQSRGDFEPIICDARSSANENIPAQSLLNNLNLPKSIQVTTKPPVPISLPMPKIPKSLTVIPQTVTRPSDK